MPRIEQDSHTLRKQRTESERKAQAVEERVIFEQ